ncbi:MAG: hypothetical protein D6698_09995 [Gammaproteobacteria bacterium]|nr:MAG: hypothetical protein D6698_09995 [Gammaproteobacteria bacterium]
MNILANTEGDLIPPYIEAVQGTSTALEVDTSLLYGTKTEDKLRIVSFEDPALWTPASGPIEAQAGECETLHYFGTANLSLGSQLLTAAVADVGLNGIPSRKLRSKLQKAEPTYRALYYFALLEVFMRYSQVFPIPKIFDFLQRPQCPLRILDCIGSVSKAPYGVDSTAILFELPDYDRIAVSYSEAGLLAFRVTPDRIADIFGPDEI